MMRATRRQGRHTDVSYHARSEADSDSLQTESRPSTCVDHLFTASELAGRNAEREYRSEG